MKFLFLGLGSIGRRHLANLHAMGYRDFYAYRQNPEAEPFETEIGVKRVSSYEAGLAERPDVVFVTNPTTFHVRDATKAVEAGVHAFVEKPLGASLKGVRELAELAHAKRCTVFVGYQLRFHPILCEIRSRLLDGIIGDVMSAKIIVGQHLADWHPGEDFHKSYAAREDLGGGVILTLSHELDYAMWLFGRARSVFATGRESKVLGISAEELADITLEFVAGARVMVHLDYLSRPPVRSCSILGRDGRIEWNYFSDRAFLFRAESSSQSEEILIPPGFERNTMYQDELSHFLKVIEGKQGSRVPLESAISTLSVALAARTSQKTGEAVLLEES